jgi:hypothetical protein
MKLIDGKGAETFATDRVDPDPKRMSSIFCEPQTQENGI